MIRSVQALAVAAGLGIVASASAQVRINEMFINPPGTDNGQEFIELFGPANMSLAGLSIVVIEGDGTGGGVVDAVLSLSSFSLGSNGLFLWRDSATVIDTSDAPGIQGPDPATIINVADFAPDIENGSNTYLIVDGFSGTVGNDLDTDNDGVLDVLPWNSVAFGLGLIENDGAANVAYATQFGGINYGPQVDFNADQLAFGTDGLLYGSDVLGASPGPYEYDLSRISPLPASPGPFFLTPGVANTIPGPAASALLGGLVLFAARRKR